MLCLTPLNQPNLLLVLMVDLPSPVISSKPGPSMDYSASGRPPFTKSSSRVGVKRAHTFSVRSDQPAYQPYSIRPTRRELRALAAKKAAEAYEEEEEDSIPLPPPMSSSSPARRRRDHQGWKYLQSSPEKRDLDVIPRQVKIKRVTYDL